MVTRANCSSTDRKRRLSTGIPANNGWLSLNWYSFTCGPALATSKSGLVVRVTPHGQVLKTVRIVHHRHRMGEKGAAHTEQESQQEKVSARVISLPSDHGRTLPWPIIWRNSLSFVEIVLRHSL